jgi:hypothetical protein
MRFVRLGGLRSRILEEVACIHTYIHRGVVHVFFLVFLRREEMNEDLSPTFYTFFTSRV